MAQGFANDLPSRAIMFLIHHIFLPLKLPQKDASDKKYEWTCWEYLKTSSRHITRNISVHIARHPTQEAMDRPENEERSLWKRAIAHPETEQSNLQYSFNLLDEHPEADTHPVYDRL